ncbi:hypothetical protein BST27_13735 [Mycobacterium intermedium]|uniref:DUF8174 domain-containing protein n=1 Tax=Mycobacterium intermedium TaxID=28445 RepID=A0A1E3SCH4_MYCIE|nr:hypothetical protein [Mycobacterium intermedium]MCV6962379.1 hypothetical protein [Mycobacterium intermedium]ODQ99865.1 hypothetical protein BHQ20_15570 [Mycobacterium intermedium]OPE51859.1 hypothetical protein BV508_04655 [Mycobacterium intermedium]ORB05023.1 hypothetical protein BST27_13735 [Mycobacterium intermedium]
MAGPHPPNPVGTDGPHEVRPYPQSGSSEPVEYPHDVSGNELAYPMTPGGRPPGEAPPNFPGGPPPPPNYRPRRSKRLFIGISMALLLVAALTAAIVYGVRTNGANTGASFPENTAKTAIQTYLDALAHRDIDIIVRNALCGLYDGVKDKRPDQALAKLSSDAFRKQFSDAEVTSIDKVVYQSQYQAQVLFSMRVKPAAGGPPRNQVQGVAQLLFQRGQILVCSYVLRTAGQY